MTNGITLNPQGSGSGFRVQDLGLLVTVLQGFRVSVFLVVSVRVYRVYP